MLVYRQNGNLAYQPETEQEIESGQQRKKVVKYVIPFKLKAKLVFYILLSTVMAIIMLGRYATVTQANLALLDIKQSIQKQESVITDLQSKFSTGMQLETIQEKAVALNMSFPENDQMVYLDVTSYNQLVENNKVNTEKNKSVFWEIID